MITLDISRLTIKRIALFYKSFATEHKLYTLIYVALMGVFIYYGIWGFVLLQLFAFTPAYIPTHTSTTPVWPAIDVDTAPIGALCVVCGTPTLHMGAHIDHAHG